ncbi:MAG TPA: heme-binding protein [Nitrospiraceae bacterium]|nr:heme-binding protein [Nitrospiraceae bacterium]
MFRTKVPKVVQRPPSILLFSIMLTLPFCTTMATAEDLPREATLPLVLAGKAATAALDKCKQDGHKVSVAVVDRAGVLKALMRGDGAGPHTINSSSKKAYTAASLRRPTGELADMVGKTPAVHGLRDMDDKILILGGGLPIEIDGEVVGGIGVGGAPGGHLDEACAAAGLTSIGASVKAPAGK